MPVYYKNEVLRYNGTLLTEFLTLPNIVSLDFELIEDEINIQDIEEFCSEYTMNNVEFEIQYKLNEVIRALKYIDNKIKEK